MWMYASMLVTWFSCWKGDWAKWNDINKKSYVCQHPNVYFYLKTKQKQKNKNWRENCALDKQRQWIFIECTFVFVLERDDTKRKPMFELFKSSENVGLDGKTSCCCCYSYRHRHSLLVQFWFVSCGCGISHQHRGESLARSYKYGCVCVAVSVCVLCVFCVI